MSACTAQSSIDSVIEGFFTELSKNNFETARSRYMYKQAGAPVRELLVDGSTGLEKTIEKLKKVETLKSDIAGEEATATVALRIATGARYQGDVHLIKEDGKAWKLSSFGRFQNVTERYLNTISSACARNNISAAQQAYDAAVKENAEDAGIYLQMARCYGRYARWPDAQKEIEKALQFDHDGFDTNYEAWPVYDVQRNLKAAEQCLLRAIKARPDNIAPRKSLISFYSNHDNWIQAAEAAQQALQLVPDDGRLLYERGFALYMTGKRSEGLPLIERAHTLLPNDFEITDRYFEVAAAPNANVARARLLAAHGELENALRQYDIALAKNSQSQEAKTERAAIAARVATVLVQEAERQFERRKYDQAAQLCDRAQAFEGNNAKAAALKQRVLAVRRILGSKEMMK
jgi:tetratricopeptide (TPR) repeat protein